MSEHYYSRHPVSAHELRTVRIEAIGVEAVCVTDAGVFSKDDLDVGTRTLLEALPPLSGRVLDLGCGWGPVGLLLKKKHPALDVVMTDINDRAVELSRQNLKRNFVEAQVVQGDGFENVAGTFDWIITNPPIRIGKAALYALFEEAVERLNPSGQLYLVIRKQQGAESALKYLRTLDPNAETVARNKGFHVIRVGKASEN